MPNTTSLHGTPNSVDFLASQAQFGDAEAQQFAHQALLNQAQSQGAFPASIYPIYRARGEGAFGPDQQFTVPAFNLRGMSYLTAQAAFEVAQELEVGLFIFELARSEMKYTDQNPRQLVSSILAAALKTKWQGPIFIQGDHYQPKAAAPGQAKAGEKDSVIQLIHDAIQAGIYNIDIDGSTLVDPAQPTDYDQQRSNFLFTAEMYKLIHQLEQQYVLDHQSPLPGKHINLGCEISEVGTHLSKSLQLAAFMTGLRDEGFIHQDEFPTKVAIETGTAHGGKVNRDGTSAPMHVNFTTLETISKIARRKYQMAGAVQHGASTLDKPLMARFPESDAAEIHLSTGLQNTILNHPAFPQELLDAMYAWCDINCREEKKSEWSQAQFYAKTRKKVWAPFKKHTWELAAEIQDEIKASLKQEFRLYFEGLKVGNSQTLVKSYY